jgi:hypothetical protein
MNKDNVFTKFLELDKPKEQPKIKPAMSKIYNRSLGNIYSAAEAQKIFNPQLPTVKAPPAAQIDQGVASAMDTSGTWGRPSE